MKGITFQKIITVTIMFRNPHLIATAIEETQGSNYGEKQKSERGDCDYEEV